MKRAGFSLLEVVLALAIIAGSLAVLGEASRLALRNATIARDTARAQLLCESKMTEIVTGETSPDPVDAMPFDEMTTDSLDPSEPAWLYSIEQEPLDNEGLIAVRVTVGRDLPEAQHPVRFSLVRWMADPYAITSDESDEMGTSDTGSSSGSDFFRRDHGWLVSTLDIALEADLGRRGACPGLSR